MCVWGGGGGKGSGREKCSSYNVHYHLVDWVISEG